MRESTNQWILGRLSGPPADLAKEREPGFEIIERTPKSLIIASFMVKINNILEQMKTKQSRNNINRCLNGMHITE